MATNTAGSSGIRNSNINGPYVLRKKITYADHASTNNDAHTVGVLPAYSVVVASQSHVVVKTAFDDTNGDDLDIGITGGDDDWFASGLDLNTGGGVLLTLDDLTDTVGDVWRRVPANGKTRTRTGETIRYQWVQA